MKRIILAISLTLLTIIMLVGYGDFSERPSSENLKVTKNDITKNTDNNTNEKIILEPTLPQWSLEQVTADMEDIDYASDDIVIFHGCFGLFVYDLNKLNIIRGLDLKPIHCNYTQGDEYCNVEVSKDGNIVQLHAGDSKKCTFILYLTILCVKQTIVLWKILFKVNL